MAAAALVATTGTSFSVPAQARHHRHHYYGRTAYAHRVCRRSPATTGKVVGGVTGAVAGAVLPGVNPVTGAVVGAVLGGVAGAVIKGRQYYRDTRGYCYYVDQYGNPIYDYNTRC